MAFYSHLPEQTALRDLLSSLAFKAIQKTEEFFQAVADRRRQQAELKLTRAQQVALMERHLNCSCMYKFERCGSCNHRLQDVISDRS